MTTLSKKNSLKKDDIVQVITGKEKGKKGKILAFFSESGKVTIEKLNMLKKHVKSDGKSRQAGIVEKEGPVHMSNVLLVCDKCGKGVRVKRKKLEDGKRVRICGKCEEVIDRV
jgi:large subunit ribosomal protein L24